MLSRLFDFWSALDQNECFADRFFLALSNKTKSCCIVQATITLKDIAAVIELRDLGLMSDSGDLYAHYDPVSYGASTGTKVRRLILSDIFPAVFNCACMC